MRKFYQKVFLVSPEASRSSSAPAPARPNPFYDGAVWRALSRTALVYAVLIALLCLTGCLPGAQTKTDPIDAPKINCTPIGRIPTTGENNPTPGYIVSLEFGGKKIHPCLVLCDNHTLQWTHLEEGCR